MANKKSKKPVPSKLSKPSRKVVNVEDLGTLKAGEIAMRFEETSEIITHLFILEPTTVLKYTHWKTREALEAQGQKEVADDYTKNVVHEHSFRTMTSQGEWMDHSNQVAGHFHVCKVVKDAKGNPVVDGNGFLTIEVGEAVTIHNGQVVPYPYDKHKHAAHYVRSNKIHVSAISADVFAKVSAVDGNFTGPKLPGVHVG